MSVMYILLKEIEEKDGARYSVLKAYDPRYEHKCNDSIVIGVPSPFMLGVAMSKIIDEVTHVAVFNDDVPVNTSFLNRQIFEYQHDDSVCITSISPINLEFLRKMYNGKYPNGAMNSTSISWALIHNDREIIEEYIKYGASFKSMRRITNIHLLEKLVNIILSDQRLFKFVNVSDIIRSVIWLKSIDLLNKCINMIYQIYGLNFYNFRKDIYNGFVNTRFSNDDVPFIIALFTKCDNTDTINFILEKLIKQNRYLELKYLFKINDIRHILIESITDDTIIKTAKNKDIFTLIWKYVRDRYNFSPKVISNMLELATSHHEYDIIDILIHDGCHLGMFPEKLFKLIVKSLNGRNIYDFVEKQPDCVCEFEINDTIIKFQSDTIFKLLNTIFDECSEHFADTYKKFHNMSYIKNDNVYLMLFLLQHKFFKNQGITTKNILYIIPILLKHNAVSVLDLVGRIIGYKNVIYLSMRSSEKISTAMLEHLRVLSKRYDKPLVNNDLIHELTPVPIPFGYHVKP